MLPLRWVLGIPRNGPGPMVPPNAVTWYPLGRSCNVSLSGSIILPYVSSINTILELL